MPTLRCALRKLLLVLVVLLVPVVAAPMAEAKGDPAAQQFRKGREQYKKKQYEAALPLFEAALEGSGSPNARLYLARTLRELGRLPEAYEQFRRTLDDARSRAEQDDKYVKTRDSSAAEIALLEPKIGKLVIAASETPEGLEISVDGASIDVGRLDDFIAVEPGTRAVVAKAPGKLTVSKEVDVDAGRTATVSLVLQDAGAEPGDTGQGEEPEEPDETADRSSGGGVRVAGFVVGAVGLASFVAYGITAAMAKDKFDTVNDACGGVRCADPSYGDEIDTGQTLETVSHVTLAVGLAGVVAGTFMVIFGGASEEEPSQAASFAPVPGGGMLTWGGSF